MPEKTENTAQPGNQNVMGPTPPPQSKVPATLSGMNSTGLMRLFEIMRPQITAALPKHLSADRMIQMATTIVARNPKIAECSTASILGSVMQASILGFRPVESLGQCYFVPYNKVCQFQIGYKGYIDLARRSGEIKMIYAEVVRKNDVFDYEFGLNPKLEHKPNPDSAGDITYVYAVAHYKDGGYNFMVLTKAQVEKLRKRNAMQKESPSGAWATDYESMAKAKVIKQLAKYMPLSDEFATAIVSDEAVITDKAFSKTGAGTLVEEFVYMDQDENTVQVVDNSSNLQFEEEHQIAETGTPAPPIVPKPQPPVDGNPQKKEQTPPDNTPEPEVARRGVTLPGNQGDAFHQEPSGKTDQ